MPQLLRLLLGAGMLLAFVSTMIADDGQPAKELVEKATRGEARAQLALAILYRDAKGVKQDYAEAMRWAHLAADQGDAGAMDFIGWMFFRGTGVQHNPKLAFGYFKAAADQSATAAWNLG